MSILAAIAVPHPPLIVPTVGKGEEKKVQATIAAYRQATAFLMAYKPDTAIIISPHATMYADYFHISPKRDAAGDFLRFGVREPRIHVRYDEELVHAITNEAVRIGLPAGTQGEREAALDHGTLVPLYFLQEQGFAGKIVRLGLSGLPATVHYRLGQCIQAAAQGDKRVCVIGSGDLSHRLKDDGPYGYRAEGPELDVQITDALKTGDFLALLNINPALAEQGAECGLRSFIMMAGALDGHAVDAKLLSYEGTFGVGYAVATFAPQQEDTSRCFADIFERDAIARTDEKRFHEDEYVHLARQGVETIVRTGKEALLPGDVDDALINSRAGVFVSLHRHGQLRGCIGTILPTTDSIAEEILQNAVSAATQDPRFPAVQPNELDSLSVKVDVLMPPEPIESVEELDVMRYGVIVSHGGRRGLLLPDLEGVDTPAQQVEIACRKAGIREGTPIKLERFEVIRHQ